MAAAHLAASGRKKTRRLATDGSSGIMLIISSFSARSRPAKGGRVSAAERGRSFTRWAHSAQEQNMVSQIPHPRVHQGFDSFAPAAAIAVIAALRRRRTCGQERKVRGGRPGALLPTACSPPSARVRQRTSGCRRSTGGWRGSERPELRGSHCCFGLKTGVYFPNGAPPGSHTVRTLLSRLSSLAGGGATYKYNV